MHRRRELLKQLAAEEDQMVERVKELNAAYHEGYEEGRKAGDRGRTVAVAQAYAKGYQEASQAARDAARGELCALLLLGLL